MKIIGERAMVQFLDGVDDLRKAKIMEYFEKAEIKARQRPAAKQPSGPAGKGRAPAGGSATAGSASSAPARPGSMRPPASGTKPAPLKRPTSTISVDREPPESPKRPTSIARPGVKPPGSLAAPSSRLANRQSLAPSVRTASPPPATNAAPKKPVEETSAPAPKLGRGLLGRVTRSYLELTVRIYPVRRRYR
jgi:protein STU2